jgi:4-hydroxybenzoate polyprenyltransferase
MLAIRYGVLYPFLKIYKFEFILSDLNFGILVLATVLITAGGYVINDYFDRRIDLTNKPENVVVGTHIERRKVMGLHNALTAIGLALAFYLSYDIDKSSFAFIFIIISGALWFYSTLYKRQLLIGNILIALLTAAVPLIVVLYDVPLILEYYLLVLIKTPFYYHEIQYAIYAVTIFSAFAFLSTFAREIIKDIQDLEGDIECGRNTLPIAWGIPTAKVFSIAFILFTIIALSFVYYIYLSGDLFSLIYLIVVLIAPMLSLIYFVMKAKKTKDYRFASNYLKVIMVLGLLYIVPFYLKITEVL